MNVTVTSSLFYFFEVVAALSAIGLVFTRNVFYGAILVIVCLLSLAGIYILAFAEFVAVVQILIYAGGILVVILFGIMLTSKISGKPLIVQHGNHFAGAIICFTVFMFLAYYFSREQFTALPPTHRGDPMNLVGVNIMVPYMLPFEIAGVLLLVTLIGAAVTASSTKPNKDVSH
jgi:NADH:ubiquinone oxidoreductase subunit 6 (subunit J)